MKRISNGFETRLFHVDAFTDRPFGGNPAAVCLLDSPADESWMQSLAAELNLSETAFVQERAGGTFGLRWFTPAAEVVLCGHATLASAHVLWEQGVLPLSSSAVFETLSGALTCVREGDRIAMNFPALAARPCEEPPGLAAALGCRIGELYSNELDRLVCLTSAAAVRGLEPDMRALKAMPGRGVIVTAPSDDSRFDFISRYFAPAFGVDEDPVTGSAHCCLGPFWAKRLGKQDLIGYQASKRGGTVRVRVHDSTGRVDLIGQAVTVMRSTLIGLRPKAYT